MNVPIAIVGEEMAVKKRSPKNASQKAYQKKRSARRRADYLEEKATRLQQRATELREFAGTGGVRIEEKIEDEEKGVLEVKVDSTGEGGRVVNWSDTQKLRKLLSVNIPAHSSDQEKDEAGLVEQEKKNEAALAEQVKEDEAAERSRLRELKWKKADEEAGKEGRERHLTWLKSEKEKASDEAKDRLRMEKAKLRKLEEVNKVMRKRRELEANKGEVEKKLRKRKELEKKRKEVLERLAKEVEEREELKRLEVMEFGVGELDFLEDDEDIDMLVIPSGQ